MEASFVTDSCCHERVMAEEAQEEEQEDLASVSSFLSEEDENESTNSMDDSMEEEEEEDMRGDATSSSSSNDQVEDHHVFEMSSLISILPFKRGLSKHYDGKSQSFTSLANVRSLEDMAKTERTWKRKKRLNQCKSYAGGGLDIHTFLSLKASSRVISKKPSRVPPSFTKVIKKTSQFL